MEHQLIKDMWPTWLTVIGETLRYFAMVSWALFLPYLAYQKPNTITTGAGTTYNYMSHATRYSSSHCRDPPRDPCW